MSLRLNYVDSHSADWVGQKITPPRARAILSAAEPAGKLRQALACGSGSGRMTGLSLVLSLIEGLPMTARLGSAAACLMFSLTLAGCQTLPMPFTNKPQAKAEPVVPPAAAEAQPTAAPAADSLPASADLKWAPKLDQPIAQLEAQMALEETQLAKNHTLSSIAYLWDARLYLLFQDTLDYLPEQAQRHEVELQNRWLDQRAEAMTRAFLNDKDGEVARFAAGQAFIAETQKRIEELERLRALVVIK